MKKIFLIALPLFLAQAISAQNVEVCKFLGDRQAAVSLTYDDGMLEHYTLVAPELEKRNLRGTFWINGNSVGMAHTEDGGRVSWNQLREMEERGHEIGNHTWSHPNCQKVGFEAFMYDVWRNDSAIIENLGHRPLTLAYPYNAMTEEVVASVDSGRIGSRTFQTGHGQLNSKTTLEKMTSWMHELIDQGEWGVTMTHGINKGYDKWDNPQELWQFYDTLAAYTPEVWVATFADVMSYAKESDALRLDQEVTGTGPSNWKMTVTPKCNLDSNIFSQPLTMKVTGLDHNIEAEQDGKVLKCYGKLSERLIDFNPFGGPITLTAAKMLDIIGDSYVANHRRPKEETWHYKMANKLGMLYNNYGRNGSCVAFDRTHDGKHNFGPAMYTKMDLMDPDADYVIIIGGHNDADKVGTSRDSLIMFKDSLELLITNIKERCPRARLGYVTPWYCERPGFKEVCKTIKSVCKRHNVPVLDNYSDNCVIKVRDDAFRKQYFQGPEDRAHLNDAGHDIFLPVAMEWFVREVANEGD